MSEVLPEPDDGEGFYYVRAKGAGMKPHTWNGYVLAEEPDSAREFIEENHSELNLGLMGLGWVKVIGKADENHIEDYVRDTHNPNAVVFRDGDEVKRVHRGMLNEP